MAIEITGGQTILQTNRNSREPVATLRAQKMVPSAVASSPQLKEAQAARSLAVVKDEPGEKEGRQVPADTESLAKLIDLMNERPQIQSRSLKFSVHEGTGKMLVRVYDSETDELIRQFPPDELLALAERIHEQLAENPSGIMLQEKA
jgi:flagellar protein FlaG